MKPIALITGASGGIGGAIAKALASDGYALALQYRSNREAIESLIRSLQPDTPYLPLACDLNDAAAVERMIETLHRTFGRPSAVIHAAGIAPRQALFSDTDDTMLSEVFATNAFAPMRLTRMLDGDLRALQGSVVTISSMWGVTGGSCETIYSASKAALIGFTKALAKELAPSGVRVNCVAPGFVQTAMNAHLSEEDVEAFRLDTPLQRLGTPEDVAEAVRYLLKAQFVTGQVLSVDGGFVI